MQIEELKKMAYMEGFVEDFIESSFEALLQTQDPQKIKHAEELSTAWKTLTTGIAKLRQENQNLQNCLQMARQALNT